MQEINSVTNSSYCLKSIDNFYQKYLQDLAVWQKGSEQFFIDLNIIIIILVKYSMQ